MEKPLRKLLTLAFGWRLFLTLFQLVVNACFEDFDSSTHLTPIAENTTSLVHQRSWLFDGLSKWDSVYFLHVAEHGYTYEQMLAFYPGFPLVISILSNFLAYFMSITRALQVVSYLVNLSYFLLAVYFFFKLTFKLSKCDLRFAKISTLFLIVNPATVFMMASYSEAQFLFLQIAMLYFLECEKYCVASVLISCSLLTRSNGLLNVAFFVYFYWKGIIASVQRTYVNEKSRNNLMFSFIKRSLFHIMNVGFYLAVVFSPFLVFQLRFYNMYCLQHTLLWQRTSKEHWCNWTVPFSYPYIQSHYWNVGLFRYYEFKQIPNFLLASPVIYIVLNAAKDFFSKLDSTSILAAFGFAVTRQSKDDNMQDGIFIPQEVLLVYVAHALFLTLYGLVGFHVQILTRMVCSSSPVVYWATSSLYIQAIRRGKSSFVSYYYLIYLLVGIVLHVNFYPWT